MRSIEFEFETKISFGRNNLNMLERAREAGKDVKTLENVDIEMVNEESSEAVVISRLGDLITKQADYFSWSMHRKEGTVVISSVAVGPRSVIIKASFSK